MTSDQSRTTATPDILITIAVCTHNREQALATTLQNFVETIGPVPTDVEVLIVDNASTDQTQAVIDRFRVPLSLRSLYEETPGLSFARNRALKDASGAWILWTDDDVDVSAGWLDAYRAAISCFPDADLFGGPILPRFEAEPDPSITEFIRIYGQIFSLTDIGPTAAPISLERTPYGANMMMRSAALGGVEFDTRLGVAGKDRMIGEETVLLEYLLAVRGGSGFWIPGAIVHHRLPAERLTRAFVRRWAIGAGKSRMRMGSVDNQPASKRSLAGQLRRGVRDFFVGGWGAMTAKGDRRVHRQFQQWSGQGQIAEVCRTILRPVRG